MLKTLPFNAMRTLESVVRLQGFARAANELNVTQSAVSQHIKMLEEWLGHRLLIRQNPHSLPTEAGVRLALAIRDGFGAIELICDDLRHTKTSWHKGVLVAAPPGFAFVWLLPRLLDFDEKNPDIPVSLSTDPKSQDPSRSDADILIAYSSGGFVNMHAEKLMSEIMAPVCSPELAKNLKNIEDLADQVVLQDTPEVSDTPSNWEFWAKEGNISLPHFKRTKKYGQANLVIQAAIHGSGVAMGRGALVDDAKKMVLSFTRFESLRNRNFPIGLCVAMRL